jgi:hypothetical protein
VNIQPDTGARENGPRKCGLLETGSGGLVSSEDRGSIAVARIDTVREESLNPPRSSVVGKESQLKVSVVPLKEVVEIAKTDPEISLAVEQLLKGQIGLVEARGARQNLGEA